MSAFNLPLYSKLYTSNAYPNLYSSQSNSNTPVPYYAANQITSPNNMYCNQSPMQYILVADTNYPACIESSNTMMQPAPVMRPQNPQIRTAQLQTICENAEVPFCDLRGPIFNALPSISIDAPEFTPSPQSSPSISPISLSPSPIPSYNTSPSPVPSSSRGSRRVKCKELFVAKYPHRAQLNIYIPQPITNGLFNRLWEQFPSPQHLYYYLDLSTALQLNDEQMYRFHIDDEVVVFANYDLHTKDTEDPIYAVIGLNDGHDKKKDKWCWKLLGFKTTTEIYDTYGVCYNELPASSRRMHAFRKQYENQRNPVIDAEVVDTTDWSNIRQIKSLRRKRDRRMYGDRNIIIHVDRNEWIKQVKAAWSTAPVIPIVVNGGKCNQHWIEWVKLIPFNGQCIGISCKYYAEYDEWMITSVCLDKGDLQNKHRLLGLIAEHDQAIYGSYFNNFNSSFTEIQWIRSF
eukprot:129857_1